MSREEFISQPMLTCLGNKRKLVNIIEDVIYDIKKELKLDKTQKLKILDGCCGSTVVSRMLSFHASKLYTNDLENYSYIMAKCFLTTPNQENQKKINNHITEMNSIAANGPYTEGVISKNYAPKETTNVQPGERCFYTRENALIIDTLRQYIQEKVEQELQHYCLAPLLVKASIHTNTAGVFKGFYKKDGVGCFGGGAGNSLARIMKTISLDPVIWNGSQAVCANEDIITLITKMTKQVDLIYLDPPYNQHPYGSNYFMLNVIADNKLSENTSVVSGIPSDWKKSEFNSKTKSIKAMKKVLELGLSKSRFMLISYNNEGIISKKEWDEILQNYNVKCYEIDYNVFKGSRNYKKRDYLVVELMFLVSKKEQN